MRHISTKICMTKDLGVHNNLFGGKLMSWIDEAAAAFACMYCDTPRMVTLKVSELLFKQPVKAGDLVKILCEPISVGNSSITIKIRVSKHNPSNGVEKEVTTAELVFVRIDSDGQTTPLSQKIRDKFNKDSK